MKQINEEFVTEIVSDLESLSDEIKDASYSFAVTAEPPLDDIEAQQERLLPYLHLIQYLQRGLNSGTIVIYEESLQSNNNLTHNRL